MRSLFSSLDLILSLRLIVRFLFGMMGRARNGSAMTTPAVCAALQRRKLRSRRRSERRGSIRGRWRRRVSWEPSSVQCPSQSPLIPLRHALQTDTFFSNSTPVGGIATRTAGAFRRNENDIRAERAAWSRILSRSRVQNGAKRIPGRRDFRRNFRAAPLGSVCHSAPDADSIRRRIVACLSAVIGHPMTHIPPRSTKAIGPKA